MDLLTALLPAKRGHSGCLRTIPCNTPPKMPHRSDPGIVAIRAETIATESHGI